MDKKQTLIEGIKVAAWNAASLLIPLLLAYLVNEPKLIAFAPVINGVGYVVKLYLDTLKPVQP